MFSGSDKEKCSQKIAAAPFTLTKVLVGGFTCSKFSEDCKKPDSSMQLEVVMSELSGKSVPGAFAKLGVENGIDTESFSLPILLRFDIPFCSIRDEESILTPNSRLFWGSATPWYTEYSLPGKGGNKVESSEAFEGGVANSSTWGSTH